MTTGSATAASWPEVKVVLTERPDGGPRRPLAAACLLGGQTVFIPAEVPCGECGPCRRALVSFCTTRVAWLGTNLQANQPITERFAYPFDPALVSERQAPWAVLLLPWLEAMGRAGLGAGDLSFWLGGSPLILLGAYLASARGSRAIVSGPASLGQAVNMLAALNTEAGPQFTPLYALDDEALQAQSSAASGFLERQIFAQSDDPVLWSAAGNLLAPGATLVVFGPLPPLAGLPADARIFTLGTHANPDFSAEALAALTRHPVLLQVCARLLAAGAFEIVPPDASA